MYLTSVKIKNFRGYGENHEREDCCFVYDDLDAPLVIFKGYNGFGKTSFYEAIEWCLTDKVYRLEKFYDDKTYQVNELKRSHYLKFYHPSHGNTSNREIFVELIFSNGMKIVRTTKNNILRTTVKDNSYMSKVLMGYDELKEVSTEEVLHAFILKTKDKETFFLTHMLGQESISDFLRHNSPSERREIFMRLLQEEKLNELFLGIQKYKTNGNALLRKYSKFEKEQSKYENDQKEIENFIKRLHFSDISSYLKSLNKCYSQIEPLIKENIVEDELNLDSLIPSDGIKLKNSVSMLQSISFTQDRIPSLNKNLITKHETLKRSKKKLETLELLEMAGIKINNSGHASNLLEKDFKGLQEQLRVITQIANDFDENKNELDNKVKKLSIHNQFFSLLSRNIDLTEMTIKEELWEDINKEKADYILFSNKFKQHLQGKSINLIVQTIDLDWFNKIKSNFEKLQIERQIELVNLENLQILKGNISKLNKQYQQSLNSVKQLISNNPQEIDNCPVCLNKDFTDDKYSDSNIKNWDSSLDISNKLLAIIDSTFSVGNEQVEELSQRESAVLLNIRQIEKEIKEDILVKITERLNTIRILFTTQFTELEKQFNDSISKLSIEIDKQKDKKMIISQQIERFNESIIALYGNDFNINELDLLKLEQVIKDKELWFKEKAPMLDLLNGDINQTVIQNEITLIKESDINTYTLEELSGSIQDTSKKIEYLNKLTSSFDLLIKYKIPAEYESTLSEFDRIGEKIEQISTQKQVIQGYLGQIDIYHEKLLSKQRQVIQERLEDHPIVSWVYETINPHPFYKKLHITNTDRGTNFTGQTQLDDNIDLYLDQIFSAAQLNILALSIFFGLGLTQRYSKLQQLFLDDPIQSLDDVNILAFIDVLRAIMDSKYGDKHIIISTHNEDFAQLLAIKMRNRRVVQYSIVGYTEEGPKIRKS
ncbi:AAA family ATPase [Sporosarcina sp. resist]|uniref:AAA family ATPase n=1 Tax=Sporosarcina sp. resist TaxID=2762563 RepID=UPI00164DB377|nr:AAA family ATPase [Sporosarcina sp. resist]QNK88101.1 AAA family ATPase [Sporosarcina sp. resist]